MNKNSPGSFCSLVYGFIFFSLPGVWIWKQKITRSCAFSETGIIFLLSSVKGWVLRATVEDPCLLKLPTHVIFGIVFYIWHCVFPASVGSGPIFLTRPCGQVQHVSTSEWHKVLPTQIMQLGQHSGCWALRQCSTWQQLTWARTTAKYRPKTGGHV